MRRLARSLVVLVLSLATLGLVAPAVSGVTVKASAAALPLKDRVRFGAFVDGMVADPTRLTSFEQLLGAPVRIASYFYGYGDEFPAANERRFADGGRRDVLLSWDMGPYSFSSWSSGAHDDYLRRIGRLAAAYPYPVYVRPWPEMNADWVDFQPTVGAAKPYGGTPQQFVAAWRHVVSTVRAAGGTRIRWVLNPTTDTYRETTDVRTIWPGRSYVDVLGMDGYNWGQDSSWGRWLSFVDIFSAQYARLTSLDSTLPVWVCEFGSKEPTEADGAPVDPTHDKGAWLTDALSTTAFPRMTALAYFETKKERDWRIESSASSLAAMRRLLQPATSGTTAVTRPTTATSPRPRTVRPTARAGVVRLAVARPATARRK